MVEALADPSVRAKASKAASLGANTVRSAVGASKADAGPAFCAAAAKAVNPRALASCAMEPGAGGWSSTPPQAATGIAVPMTANAHKAVAGQLVMTRLHRSLVEVTIWFHYALHSSH
jgi:hypothetical protein